MPSGAIGTCWAEDSWLDTAWEAGSWGDVPVAAPAQLLEEGHVNDFYNAAQAITPSDTVPHPYVFDAIYVGVAGNISVKPVGAQASVVFVGVPAGYILRVQGERVNSTSTTATNLVAMKRH